MFKKILLLGTLSLGTLINSFAFANSIPYVGASLGIANNTSDLGVTNGSLRGGNFRGMPVSVFAGYGGVLNQNLYLAGEVFATLTTPIINNNNGVLKTNYGYGLSILPGVMLTDHTLAYLRAGIVRTRFPSTSNTVTGGQFGFGLQTSLTQNVDIRGEYDYVAYRSFNYTVASTAASLTPRSDQFNLGLVYKFD